MKDINSFESSRGFIYKILFKIGGYLFLAIFITLLILKLIGNFQDIVPMIITLFFVLFSFVVWKGFNYKLTRTHFEICIFSVVIYDVLISRIRTVSKKRSSSYVYGLSMDTITLHLGNKQINITPKDKKRFLKKLILINPRISLEGSISLIVEDPK